MSAIANRYAKALVDVVSEKGDYNQAKIALGSFHQLLASYPELKDIFQNPTIPLAQKRGLLKGLLERLSPPPMIGNFLMILLDNMRLHQLDEIMSAFNQEVDQRIGVVTADITTAAPITEKERQQLAQRLDQMTGKQVRLRFKTDAELIGGVVTQIGSVIYDGSIRNQLQQIKATLEKE